jgi:hypothetical protein
MSIISEYPRKGIRLPIIEDTCDYKPGDDTSVILQGLRNSCSRS